MHDGTIYWEKCLEADWLHPHHMAKVLLRAKRNSPVDIGIDKTILCVLNPEEGIEQ